MNNSVFSDVVHCVRSAVSCESTGMHRTPRPMLTDLNPLLICALCRGYLIDATTLTECLHSFCRSCLVRYFHTSKNCPTCDTLVHESRPLLNARPDKALQSIVYKAVPGLFKDEMRKRREFYTKHPIDSSTSVSSGKLEVEEVDDGRAAVIHTDDECMNLSLEYFFPAGGSNSADETSGEGEASVIRPYDVIENMADEDEIDIRYLRCPAKVCVKQIKKLIMHKFELKQKYQIELTHADDDENPLSDDYTLMDVAYIYEWRRIGPLPLVFKVFQDTRKRQKIKHIPISNGTTGISDDSFLSEHLTPESLENTAVTTIHEITNNAVIERERGDESSGERRNVIKLKESGSYKVSPEMSLTERQLLPKLRIPMINVFQMTSVVRGNTEGPPMNSIVDDSVNPTTKSDEKLENTHKGIGSVENNGRRMLLQEIVKEEIDVSLLEVGSNSNKKLNGKNDSTMQYNSEGIPISTATKLSSPVVSVR